MVSDLIRTFLFTTYNVGDMHGLHSASNPHELVMLQVPSLDIIVSNIHILGEVTSHITLPSAGLAFLSSIAGSLGESNNLNLRKAVRFGWTLNVAGVCGYIYSLNYPVLVTKYQVIQAVTFLSASWRSRFII